MNGLEEDGLSHFLKKKGLISEKQQEKLNKQKLFEEAKESQMYKSVLKIFPDADLIDIKTYGDKDEWFQQNIR